MPVHVFGYRLPGLVLVLAPLLPLLAGAGYAWSRGSRPQRAALGLYLAGLVGIALLTLAPWANAGLAGEAGAGAGGALHCQLSLAGAVRPPWQEGQRLLNVAVFVPLGLLATLMVRGRRWPLALALAAPVAIEAVQSRVPALGRACDAVDALDNVTGVVLGAALGAAALLLTRSRG